jgi:hypothetical protein
MNDAIIVIKLAFFYILTSALIGVAIGGLAFAVYELIHSL